MESEAHVGHSHGVAADANRRRLTFALSLILIFIAAEVTAGILAHSLALLSDAAHMLTDAGAIALSLLALRLAARPPSGSMTYGLKRAEILSAQANGATLLVLAVLIVYEAIHRLISPPAVDGWVVVIAASAGIAVNLLASRQLARANRENMAVEGSFQHIVTDLYAFIGTAIAGVVILTTGFVRVDAIVSLGVAALMLRASYGLLKDSGRVLLEMAPAGVSAPEIGQALAGHAEVAEVHDLHVWEIGTDLPALSAHVLVRQGVDCHGVRRELELMLHERFAIDHTTLQVEHVGSQSQLIELRKIER
jgi:cobalt-zinc-cadmium efflux system protein